MIHHNNELAVLKHYASGDGSLSFVWENKYTRKAIGEPVTMGEAMEYMQEHKDYFDGWKLLDRFGIPKAYIPVERASVDIVRMGEGVPRYYRYERAGHVLRIWEQDFDEEYEVKNMNVLGVITFFLENEELLK